MGPSQFQFSNPILLELQFYVNDTYNPEDTEIDIGVDISLSKERVSENEAVVELTLELGEHNEKAPFYIKAVEGAKFRWEDGAFKKESELERLLNINAPALLLSYMRPIISNITGMSQYPAYHIPFVNFNNTKK